MENNADLEKRISEESLSWQKPIVKVTESELKQIVGKLHIFTGQDIQSWKFQAMWLPTKKDITIEVVPEKKIILP